MGKECRPLHTHSGAGRSRDHPGAPGASLHCIPEVLREVRALLAAPGSVPPVSAGTDGRPAMPPSARSTAEGLRWPLRPQSGAPARCALLTRCGSSAIGSSKSSARLGESGQCSLIACLTLGKTSPQSFAREAEEAAGVRRDGRALPAARLPSGRRQPTAPLRHGSLAGAGHPALGGAEQRRPVAASRTRLQRPEEVGFREGLLGSSFSARRPCRENLRCLP